MTEFIESDTCGECRTLENQGDYVHAPTMFICKNKKSYHYGHVLATWHPKCHEFKQKPKKRKKGDTIY